MRSIDTHKGSKANDSIEIQAIDEPGPGGAHHLYHVIVSPRERPTVFALGFQKGPVPAVGVNGVTEESLLAIMIDRLECFQAGPYACPENNAALENARASLDCLQRRTFDRVRRGVEGKYEA